MDGSRARYGSSRISSAAGYEDEPAVYSGLSFDLRALPRITSRIVRSGNRVYELWSPNSTQLPFLPGERSSDFVPHMHSVLDQRRYDGHAGKFDCLYVPQYYKTGNAHWPYMRRPLRVDVQDAAYDAYVPLHRVWRCCSGSPEEGEFEPSFIDRLVALVRRLDRDMQSSFRSTESQVWSARPQYTTEARVHALSRVSRWEDAVDYGVAVQRGLREKEAWIAMQKARVPLRLGRLRFLQRKAQSALTADDKYIGLWINGVSEVAALMYISTEVPCFVVHEYKTGGCVPERHRATSTRVPQFRRWHRRPPPRLREPLRAEGSL